MVLWYYAGVWSVSQLTGRLVQWGLCLGRSGIRMDLSEHLRGVEHFVGQLGMLALRSWDEDRVFDYLRSHFVFQQQTTALNKRGAGYIVLALNLAVLRLCAFSIKDPSCSLRAIIV